MKLSVRVAVAGMCVLAVAVASIVIISISSHYSRGVAVDLGHDHAEALSEIALLKTERYFDEMAMHARQMQVLAKRSGFMLPKDDPVPEWYKKWHGLIEPPLIGSNYSYVHIFGVFADDTVFRCKVLPRGPGLQGRVLSSYVYNPHKTPEAEEHQHYLGNQSTVPESNKEHYPFSNINGTRFPFYRLGTFWSKNNTPDSAYWLNVGMVAFPSEVVIPAGVPLHNSSGHFMGHAYVVRTFTQTNDFLLSTVSKFKGVKGFIIDQDGLMVGTTEAQPTFTQTYHKTRDNLTVDKYCAVSPPTDPNVTLTCRTHVEQYAFIGLPQEYHRLQSEHPSQEDPQRNHLSERKYGGEEYFVVTSDVNNVHPVNFRLRLFLFYPKHNVLQGVEESQNLTIGLGALVAIVSALLAVIGIHLLLRPLAVLGKELRLMGTLRTSGRAPKESFLSEIYALQLAFLDMHAKLHEVKRFVPHGLLSRVDQDLAASTTTSTDGAEPFATSLSPRTGQDPLHSGCEQPSSGSSASMTGSIGPSCALFGVNKVKLKKETNVFLTKKCSVLSIEVTNLPDDADSLQRASDVIMKAFVESVLHFGGVIDRMAPHKCTATFNAHAPCHGHEQRAFDCALRVSSQLQRTPYAHSIAVDTTLHYIGAIGHGMHSALSMFGEGLEMLDRLHAAARSYLRSRVLVTERCVASIQPKKFTPVDVLIPNWVQDTRKQSIVVYEPAAFLCTDGMRAIFSYLLSGEYKKATEAIEKERKTVPEHGETCARLLTASSSCATRKSTPTVATFGRLEVPRFEALGNEVLPEPDVVTLDGRESTHNDAMFEALKDAVERAQPTSQFEQEGGLIGMFLPTEESTHDSPGEEDGDDTTENLPRIVVDSQQREWRRCDDVLGTGAFSVVYKGIGDRGHFCALKFRKITEDTEVSELASELDMISKLSHENLVNYYACCATRKHLVLVMEYVTSGTLRSLSQAFNGIPLELLKQNARDILTGLAFLHSQGIVHCDLKPDNVLVNVDGICKLCDFGASIAQHMSCSSYLHVRGTAAYMAPEVAQGHSPTERSDIWSFGVTMVEVLTNQPPWPKMPRGPTGEAQLIEQIGKTERMVPVLPPELRTRKMEEMASLIDRCLQRDPRKRPTVQQLLASSFFI